MSRVRFPVIVVRLLSPLNCTPLLVMMEFGASDVMPLKSSRPTTPLGALTLSVWTLCRRDSVERSGSADWLEIANGPATLTRLGIEIASGPAIDTLWPAVRRRGRWRSSTGCVPSPALTVSLPTCSRHGSAIAKSEDGLIVRSAR